MASDTKELNQRYYGTLKRGRGDYWRKMAAPRFRVDTLLSAVGLFPAGRAVDLGCGDGALLCAFAARYPDMALSGVDLSETQIAENRTRLPAIQWFVADLDGPAAALAGIPPADFVFASEIIEHVEFPSRFLANARLLAKNGGLLLLSTQSGRVGETERRVGHRRHFTVDEMTDLLTSSGWRPERAWNCGFPFHDGSKWVANLSPDVSMRHFGEQSYGFWQNAVCALLRVLFRLNSTERGAQLFALARAAD